MVLIILSSAGVADYQAIVRLFDPQSVEVLWAVVAASVLGFLGNEVVAVFRVRVGREIRSAALIADGYHARTDGWTSLAVLLGALGVWLGYRSPTLSWACSSPSPSSSSSSSPVRWCLLASWTE